MNPRKERSFQRKPQIQPQCLTVVWTNVRYFETTRTPRNRLNRKNMNKPFEFSHLLRGFALRRSNESPKRLSEGLQRRRSREKENAWDDFRRTRWFSFDFFFGSDNIVDFVWYAFMVFTWFKGLRISFGRLLDVSLPLVQHQWAWPTDEKSPSQSFQMKPRRRTCWPSLLIPLSNRGALTLELPDQKNWIGWEVPPNWSVLEDKICGAHLVGWQGGQTMDGLGVIELVVKFSSSWWFSDVFFRMFFYFTQRLHGILVAS